MPRPPRIDPAYGRVAFGADPAAYHATRPAYPGWVFDTLRERCGLAAGTATFEIGAGTGTATRALLDHGASPLLAVEPDPRLAAYLRRSIPDAALSVAVAPFEDAAIAPAGFDLGVCATAFHWLDEPAALAKIATLLRPGAWWAAFWNVFGDDTRPDPFHEATKTLLQGPESPSFGTRGIPFALDTARRTAALHRTGAFEAAAHQCRPWSLTLDAAGTVALYATYSNVNIRPDRDAVLAELGRIAREHFHDRVTRNMLTILYTARRS